MTLTLGFSPCPNDTFIFDALVNKKIDTEGLEFTPVLEDVETLNEWALTGKLDITKLSFPAFFQSLQHYQLLHSGSALGKGVGPLLISKKEISIGDGSHYSISLPGQHTTAHLLFSFAYPAATQKKFRLFSEIEDAVVNKETDLGVIIHENRFTYQQKGLHKVKDLGTHWEEKMQAPIPLGGIAIHRQHSDELARKIERLIRQSLEFAYANYTTLPAYVQEHAQAMQEEVMRQHIDLYVNNYSLQLGAEGKQAIRTLYNLYTTTNNVANTENVDLFL